VHLLLIAVSRTVGALALFLPFCFALVSPILLCPELDDSEGFEGCHLCPTDVSDADGLFLGSEGSEGSVISKAPAESAFCDQLVDE